MGTSFFFSRNLVCPPSEDFAKEAPFVYRLYLYTGAGSFLCVFSVLMIYMCNKKLRMHPNGILIHLMVALCVFSLEYLVNGIVHRLGPEHIISCRSFGIPHTDCHAESTVIMFFAFSFLGWNFVWLFDLIKVFKQPMHTTDQLLSFYKFIVYLSALAIAATFYFFRHQVFTMGPTYLCSLDRAVYKYVISGTELLYLLVAGYTVYKYGRDSVIRRFKKTGSKLQSFFRTQKCYFFLSTCCCVMDMIFLFRDTETTRQAYAIARSVEPSILSLPWIISIVNSIWGRSKVAPMAAKTAESEEPVRRDSLLGDGLKELDIQNQSNEDAGMNKKVMDDAMRNEIVEYLLKGIRRSIVSCSSAKKGLGDTEEPEGCAKRFFKTLCCCLGDSKDGDKSRKASATHEDASMFKRVNLIERKFIIKEARREQVFNIPLDNRRMGNEFFFDDDEYEGSAREANKDIKFVSLGPKVFQNLRSLHNINENDIMSLFSVTNLLQKKLKVVLQSGKGGSFFVLPENGKYLIKSINEGEYAVMKKILPDLYVHYLTYPTSFINPIYGCYALFLSEDDEIEPQYFVLMKNVLDVNKEQLPEGSEVLCFDLKGSTAGRKALPDPRVLLGPGIPSEVQALTLKDEDFILSFKTLELSPVQSSNIMHQLEADAKFFAKFSLIDYSLLLFMVNVPYKGYTSARRGRVEHEKGGCKRANELVVGEKNLGAGKTELVIEERGRSTNATYRVINASDVEAFRMIDEKSKAAEAQDLYSIRLRSAEFDLDEEGKGRFIKRIGSRGMLVELPKRFPKAPEVAKAATPTDSKVAPKTNIRHVFNFPTVLSAEAAANKASMVNESSRDLKDSSSFFESMDSRIQTETVDVGTENQVTKKLTARDLDTVSFRGDEELSITKKRNYAQKSEEDAFDVRTTLNDQRNAEPTVAVPETVEQLIYDSSRGGFYKRELMFGIIDFLTVVLGNDQVALHDAEETRATVQGLSPEESLGCCTG